MFPERLAAAAFPRQPAVGRLRLDRKLPRHHDVVQALARRAVLAPFLAAAQDDVLVAIARLHRDARHGTEGVGSSPAAALPRLGRFRRGATASGAGAHVGAPHAQAAPALLPRAGPAAAAQGVAAVAVAGRVAGRAEEGAQADLLGALADEGVDDEEVGDDDGDKGLAAGPLAARGGAFGSGLLPKRKKLVVLPPVFRCGYQKSVGGNVP